MQTYVKVRFASPSHETVGLVFKSEDLVRHNVSSLSRIFPPSEFLRMGSRLVRVELSPDFPTWEEAFNHQFAEPMFERCEGASK